MDLLKPAYDSGQVLAKSQKSSNSIQQNVPMEMEDTQGSWTYNALLAIWNEWITICERKKSRPSV